MLLFLLYKQRKQIVLKNTFVTLDKTTEELMERNAVNIIRNFKRNSEVANTSPISIEKTKEILKLYNKVLKKQKKNKKKQEKITN